jgi:hypothetical protein
MRGCGLTPKGRTALCRDPNQKVLQTKREIKDEDILAG